ncbi:MAG: RDD family protein [Candidatus Pacebacteria bacterium]|nr:RDD family protein [Candidatus Paceibacterota bacterium]
MANTQLLEYVKQQIAQGLTKESIQQNLVSAGGWNLVDVNDAFATLELNQPAHNPVAPTGTVPTPPVNVKYAGFWVRFVAIMVDSLIIAIPIAMTQFLLGLILIKNPGSATQTAGALSYVVSLLLTWTYFTLMTYYSGATLGKMLVGITVKSDSFEKLSFGKVLLRETLGKFVSQIILCIGFIIAGFTAKKQGLHDMFAHSVVIYKDPAKPHTAGLVVGIIIACILPMIAIFGIMSSVVLVALSSARQKGQDAQVRTVLSQLRTQAEVYYGDNNTYSKTRSCSQGMFADASFASVFVQLKDKNVVTCYAEGETYAISAVLNSSGSSYCYDSAAVSGDGVAFDDGSTASCKIMSSSLNSTNI